MGKSTRARRIGGCGQHLGHQFAAKAVRKLPEHAVEHYVVPLAPNQKYVTAADNQAVTVDQTAPLPPTIAAAVEEHVAAETAEARCARDADKLANTRKTRPRQRCDPWKDRPAAKT
jgi:hypothetical protein